MQISFYSLKTIIGRIEKSIRETETILMKEKLACPCVLLINSSEKQ